jgi:hypothetical protein
MSFNLPEEIPFTNDDEAARQAAASPVLRATKDDECMQFYVMKEEAIIIEKGLYPGAFAVRLTCAPIDGNDSPRTNLTVRHDLVLPVPNPESEKFSEQGPDTGKDCERYFTAKDSKKYPPLPTWNKESKCWQTAAGEVVSRQDYEAQKQKLYSVIIKELRTAWNAMRKGETAGFVDDTFYAQVKAGGDQKQYRNLKNLSATPVANTTVVTEGFKTTVEG